MHAFSNASPNSAEWPRVEIFFHDTHRQFDELLRDTDAELARLSRREGQLKLRLGELFDALFELRGHHELGFSSFEAYVVQRCQRSGSWGRDTRRLAKRIRQRRLETLRQALRAGRIGMSMAELIARYATAETELEMIERASQTTVRKMKIELSGTEETPDKGTEMIRTRRLLTSQDRLMLNASRILVGHLNGRSANDEALFTALLGEGETSLQNINAGISKVVPKAPSYKPRSANTLDEDEDTDVDVASVMVEVFEERPIPTSIVELDLEIIERCLELARRNLEMGRLCIAMVGSRGWARLGYKSAEAYTNERLGLSLSSLEHRALLARRVRRFPELGRAIEDGHIGYEAGLLITRVIGRWAKCELVQAWIDRARVRTVKCLREEVDAVLTALDLDADASGFPPTAEELEAVFEYERSVQSGELLSGVAKRTPQTFVTLSLQEAPEPEASDAEYASKTNMREPLGDLGAAHRSLGRHLETCVPPRPSPLYEPCLQPTGYHAASHSLSCTRGI